MTSLETTSSAASVRLLILTEFHESARVDRQLFGRCARQGDPGTTEAIVSVDDELFRRFAPALALWMMRTWVGKHRQSNRWLRRWVAYVQDRAERHYRRQRTDTSSAKPQEETLRSRRAAREQTRGFSAAC